jgi:hypothetical protein
VNHTTRQRVDLSYDATQPTDVTTSAPERSLEPQFPVSWSGTDAVSGVAYFTVEYSNGVQSAWQPWLPSTTATSAVFTAPIMDVEYTFRVTARDLAGNSAQSQVSVMVGMYRIYLPALVGQWRSWYHYDIYEPNDTLAQAYGPLASNQVYQAYIWDAGDRNDFYHFTPASGAPVQIALTNIPAGCDFDLYVYYDAGAPKFVAESANTGNKDESITFTPTAGRKYYVWVYRYVGSSGQQPYRLKVVYQ